MKGTIATILGTMVCLAALAAWFFIAPAAGSGWILLVAFIGTIGLLNSVRDPGLAPIAGFTITLAAAAIWFARSGLPDAGWVLALAVLSALGAFNSMNVSISAGTKTAKKKK
ncbi:hypothetical protein BH10CYA1_BH10CYA1_60830 [soil metagenome]